MLLCILLFSVLLQVNGKQFPLAKIKLGRMGALHPANRLAAYLTGRVGSMKPRQSSLSSEPSCNLQSFPHVTSSAYCVPPAPAAPTVAPAVVQSQPPATQPTLPTPLPTPSAGKDIYLCIWWSATSHCTANKHNWMMKL